MSIALGRSLTLVRMHRSISSRTSSVHSSGTLHSCKPSQAACFLHPIPSEVSSRSEPVYNNSHTSSKSLNRCAFVRLCAL